MNKIELTKYENLKKYLSDLKSAVVAFSAGVDSTFLLKMAKDVLGDNVIAVTLSSSFFAEKELKEALDFCKNNNIKHYVLEIDMSEIQGFVENPKDRCYLCKKYLFSKIKEFAKKNNRKHIIEGTNFDDTKDYRPGLKAIRELEIKSPLLETGFTKEEIREFSKKLGLNTAQKSSFACLASRFVFGETITKDKLKMVDKAEQLLSDAGFKQFRVRIHNLVARIEVMPEEFEKLIQSDIRQKILTEFYGYGFNYVSLDLDGYKTGSMNKMLTDGGYQVL